MPGVTPGSFFWEAGERREDWPPACETKPPTDCRYKQGVRDKKSVALLVLGLIFGNRVGAAEAKKKAQSA